MDTITTLDELIARLEELKQDHKLGGDLPVRIAYQPNYPIAAALAAVNIVDGKLWLATGAVEYRESPYAPAAAWDR